MSFKRYFLWLTFLLTIYGCYLPNDSINPTKFHFDIDEKLENIEDVFFNSDFDYKEVNYTNNWTRTPSYNLVINHNDTIISYEIQFNDCENYNSYLNSYNDTIKYMDIYNLKNCNRTFVGIKKYSGNYDSISNLKAKEIFKKGCIDKLKKISKNNSAKYHLEIDRKHQDTVYINILDENQKVRKKRIFVKNILDYRKANNLHESFNEVEILDYRKATLVKYTFSKPQHFMYIESKTTTELFQ